MRIFFSEKLGEFIIVSLLVFVFLFTGLSGISKQSLVDEPLWAFDRVEQYWANIYKGNWEYVRPSDKPGVTVSLLSGYGLKNTLRPSRIKDTISPSDREVLLRDMRAPLVFFLTSLLPLFYFLLRRLCGRDISLFGLCFVALSPLLIGMSRILNPDALLWLLLPLTVLAYFNLLTVQTTDRRKHWQYVILTGILFGLCLLTKYVSNILFIFLPLSFLVYTVYNHDRFISLRSTLRKQSITFALVTVTAVLTYVILLPSVWVRPEQILEGTIWSQAFAPIWKVYIIALLIILSDLFLTPSSLLVRLIEKLTYVKVRLVPILARLWLAIIGFVLVTAHLSDKIDYQAALHSPKASGRDLGTLTTILTDFYILIFGLTVIAFLCTIYGLTQLAQKRNYSSFSWVMALILTFPPLYYAGSALSGVTTILRYQIALYPLILIIAAYGVFILITNHAKENHHNKAVFGAVLLITLFSGASLLHVKPFYFSYTNPLLPDHQILNIKDMGDGSYQAAAFLNELRDAENLTIWSDKYGVCAAFVGSCSTSLTDTYKLGLEYDYYVASRGRQFLTTRTSKSKRGKDEAPEIVPYFSKLYESDVPSVFTLHLGNRPHNFVRIVDAKAFDIHDINDRK